MVLGASVLQMPAIRKATELRYEVAAVDRDARAPGVRLADRFYKLSTIDVDGIVAAAREFRPAGIITIGTDMPMRALSAAAESLGLAAPSPASVFRATDKGAMASAFAAHAVPAPWTLSIEGVVRPEHRKLIKERLPVIVKPADSSGSRGVSLVATVEALDAAFAYAGEFTPSSRVLVQEYMRGPEVSVEGFRFGGRTTIVAITDKITSGAPHFVELGHSQPSRHDDTTQAQIRAVVRHAVEALELDNCAIHAELILTETGPRMVEIGARLGGDFITSHLVPLSSGVDMIAALIDVALGKSPRTARLFRRGSAVRFLDRPGHAARVHDALALPGVTEAAITGGIGEQGPRSSTDRVGHVIAVGYDAADAAASAEAGMRILTGQAARTQQIGGERMREQRMLVLGAGRGQLGLIKAAKALGVETYVASLPSQTAPGLALADKVVTVDIADIGAVEAAAREHAITAIATSCADTGVPALGRVCDELGLPGLTERAAAICADKNLMKQAFTQGGVRTAEYRTIHTVRELDTAAEQLGYPVIIKAVDLQGSMGITIARDADEARTGFGFAMKATSRDFVIIEQFIEGEEFGAQALIYDGEVIYVLPHGDEVLMAKTAVPIGHSVPLERDANFLERVITETTKAIRAIGLDNCAVNIDLIDRDGQIFVIELTGRAGANGLPEMVSAHYGVNYYEIVARLALGDDPRALWPGEHAERPAVAVRMVAMPDSYGVIEKISIDESAVPDADYVMFRRTGDTLSGFTNSGDCVGQVTVCAATLELAMRKLDDASQAISLTVV